MFTVAIVSRRSGKPASGKRVSVRSDGLFGGGLEGDQYTDERGEVHIDHDRVNGKVYIDGRSEHRGRLSGRVVVYI